MILSPRPHPVAKHRGTPAYQAYARALVRFIKVVDAFTPTQANRREFAALIYFAVKHYGVPNYMLASRAHTNRNAIISWMRGTLTERDRARWPQIQTALLQLLAEQLPHPPEGV